MINNEFQMLPFYKDIESQNYRKPYNYGTIYPLIQPVNAIPSFQLEISHIDTASPKFVEYLESASIYSVKGQFMADIKQYIYEAWTYMASVSDTTDALVVCPFTDDAINIKEGFGYIKLVFALTNETFYSEVMCFDKRAGDKIKLAWHDSARFDINESCSLLYDKGYDNILYIDSIVGKPEYTIDEEGEERDGYFFAEKQISKKTYRFSFVAPEFVCDILRLTSMSDVIKVSYGGRSYDCDSMLVSVDWEEQGDLASVDIEFTADSIIKKIAARWPQ